MNCKQKGLSNFKFLVAYLQDLKEYPGFYILEIF